eukprot:4478173-Prymnesium_polylepis.1
MHACKFGYVGLWVPAVSTVSARVACARRVSPSSLQVDITDMRTTTQDPHGQPSAHAARAAQRDLHCQYGFMVALQEIPCSRRSSAARSWARGRCGTRRSFSGAGPGPVEPRTAPRPAAGAGLEAPTPAIGQLEPGEAGGHPAVAAADAGHGRCRWLGGAAVRAAPHPPVEQQQGAAAQPPSHRRPSRRGHRLNKGAQRVARRRVRSRWARWARPSSELARRVSPSSLRVR